MNLEAYPQQGPDGSKRVRAGFPEAIPHEVRNGAKSMQTNDCRAPRRLSAWRFPSGRHTSNLIALHRPKEVRFEPAVLIAVPVLIPRTRRQGARQGRIFAGWMEYGPIRTEEPIGQFRGCGDGSREFGVGEWP